jgi:hypothetical protein
MLAQKPQTLKRRLVISAKTPKTMTIKDRRINEVRPPSVHVAKLQGVELKAEDDCQVVFDDFAFVLNKGQSHVVSFSTDGNYHFEVKYLGSGTRRRPVQTRAVAKTVSCTVFAPRALLATMQLASGPTGDIRVP